MALHSRADVAGEALQHVLVLVLHAPPHRHHVAHPAVLRVDGRHDVVEQRALVEVGVVRVGVQGEQLPGELEHVVDVARLARAAVDEIAELVRRSEVLILPVAAGGEAVMLGDLVPEERGSHQVGWVPGIDEPLQRPDELGDLRVAVRAAEVVLVTLQRLDEHVVLELVGEPQPALVAGVGVEVRQHLVHAAELRVQHSLDLGVVQPGEDPLGPRRESRLHGQRGAVAGEPIRVAQPRVGLVQRVPRRPFAVQVEGSGTNLTFRQRVERPPAAFQGAQVAVAVLVLHRFQLSHDVVRALPEARVPGGRPHQAHSGQVMAGDVAREIPAAAVPAPVGLRLRLEPRALAIVRQHPVGLERQQVLAIQILRVLQRPTCQPDGRQGQRAGLETRGVRGAGRAGGLRGDDPGATEQVQRTGAEAELERVTARERHGRPPRFTGRSPTDRRRTRRRATAELPGGPRGGAAVAATAVTPRPN